MRIMRDMSFSEALRAMKHGGKVARAGWNGKGMWICIGSGTPGLSASSFWNQHTRAFAEENGGHADVEPYLIMKTAQNTIQMGWVPSQADVLADDWQELLA
ncbi:DUF2829 domain-containing protein [Mesorhizobium sp. M7A.F.Ca.CA.002.12.1.1]|uniref:DUF2829 domain-containing protein n=1 Tax=Mesorhizobium sp. M7A.F.Ca.CA.002.12.1.1 TaxID=2496735 RepID=UPI000FCAD2F6|nr:DUF2829 domain-containing protein [Mesorhizobium sp. M7A.F.Ca.CA.002.12.1.1]RUX60148.1 DUF2829 domain-containing protein [Mesorhizobium sp. M7A.F.Ca.CA.002.12.1.1]